MNRLGGSAYELHPDVSTGRTRGTRDVNVRCRSGRQRLYSRGRGDVFARHRACGARPQVSKRGRLTGGDAYLNPFARECSRDGSTGPRSLGGDQSVVTQDGLGAARVRVQTDGFHGLIRDAQVDKPEGVRRTRVDSMSVRGEVLVGHVKRDATVMRIWDAGVTPVEEREVAGSAFERRRERQRENVQGQGFARCHRKSRLCRHAPHRSRQIATQRGVCVRVRRKEWRIRMGSSAAGSAKKNK